MIGFSFKNIVLQIIQGGIILITALYFVFGLEVYNIKFITEENSSIIYALFLCVSYVLGVLIDFLSDIVETAAIKWHWIHPPSYHLLKKGSAYGIRLAHYNKIKSDLETLAKKFQPKKLNDVNYCNLIFQTAKNKALRECSEYQKDHLESFFTLYVFCRNISLCLFVVLVALVVKCNSELCIWIIPTVILVILFVLASYRYFSYYSRMILGATFTKKSAKQ
ncbi:MAG: hypothetical protein AB7S48_15960 [Bacteroidales bacterium]